MKALVFAVGVLLAAEGLSMPVPKEKPTLFDPSGVWVTESLSEWGRPFENGEGYDLFRSQFDLKLTNKICTLKMSKSIEPTTYAIGRVTQEAKSCRFECVSERSVAYMSRFRVLCKMEGDVLWLSLIDKYKNETEEGKIWPTSFDSADSQSLGGIVLKLKKVKK